MVNGVSIVYPLLLGLAVFSISALLHGYTLRQTFQMAYRGSQKSKGVIVLLLLIGAITGIWRGCGVIPYLIYHCAGLIQPGIFLLSAFLLCAGISMVTGTAFGTASTMGVVLAIMGNMSGVNPAYTCGAIMAGAYFGDRASPMSSAARLLSEITGTDYYDNFKLWMRSSAVPFLLSAAIYLLLGGANAAAARTGLTDRFTQEFTMHWSLALPPVLVVLLSVLRVRVRLNLMINIALSSALAVLLQKFTALRLLSTLVLGFKLEHSQLAGMLSGGGVISMARAAVIILISSAFVGILEETRMLSGFERRLASVNRKAGPFAATLLTGLVTAAVSCNQTLSILLTNQLCKGFYSSQSELATDISDTTVLLAAFIPWSIACTLPLMVIGGDYRCLPFAFFMYLTPLCSLFSAQMKRARKKNGPVRNSQNRP